MIAKLSKADVESLRSLSRGGSSDRALMEAFSVSRATVQRYKHDSMRDLSRSVMRNRSKPERTCSKCGSMYDGHPRCSVCGIAVHNGLERCDSCAQSLH